jgi:hypothetical protein
VVDAPVELAEAPDPSSRRAGEAPVDVGVPLGELLGELLTGGRAQPVELLLEPNGTARDRRPGRRLRRETVMDR